MRHQPHSASSIPFTRKFAAIAGIASLGASVSFLALLSTAPPANADTVWASKDCSLSPCIVTTGGTPAYPGQVPGRFRIISPAQWTWSALYTGTPSQPQRFWVSQSGMNVATNQLSTANGQLGGTISLPNGLWFISVRTALMGPGNYSVTGPNVLGDPHITTLDATRYDFQGAGEFVLLKNKDAGFEVQSRMSPVSTVAPLPPDAHTGISSCPSINTAAAVRSPKHRFSYQPGKGSNSQSSRMQLRIDGMRRLPLGGSMTLNDGTRVTLNRASSELLILLRNGWGVRVVPTWWAATSRWYLNFEFTPASSAVGVAGPLAERSWLPALADGSNAGPMPGPLPERYKVLYEKFADSWRVSPATSLFDYAAGTSTGTFTNRAWPGESGSCRLPNTNPLPQLSEIQAAKICRGVIPSFRAACIADVMGTGDRIFAAGYARTQGPARFKARAPDSKSHQYQ